MSFIYMVPGNWFEIKNLKTDKVWPYDLEAFKAEVLNQVSNRSEMLGFIKTSYGSAYGPGNKLVENVIFHLDEAKFEQLAAQAASEKCHPILTFHGTNPTATNAILETGYRIPQMTKGAKIAHGAMYGVGVYTSPFFDKAISYAGAIAQPRGQLQQGVALLINMVFLGTVKMIPPGGKVDNKVPVGGIHADGSHTRVVFGLDQLMSSDPVRVVPIAVVEVHRGA